ncbi:hypothetical protein AAX29_00635 [Aliarcobacter thereius]|uniref:Uncharacterized protein n=1 Tax=Aliarcobacter thereius TaxID=544718 RepID=A0A1C0B7M2_9BACT|nr:hypothetical protein [Aliarcobacter thereius]OCL99590.1 hypothetical protein AAX29_00635 [Aliarcobacter thereius]
MKSDFDEFLKDKAIFEERNNNIALVIKSKYLLYSFKYKELKNYSYWYKLIITFLKQKNQQRVC